MIIFPVGVFVCVWCVYACWCVCAHMDVVYVYIHVYDKCLHEWPCTHTCAICVHTYGTTCMCIFICIHMQEWHTCVLCRVCGMWMCVYVCTHVWYVCCACMACVHMCSCAVRVCICGVVHALCQCVHMMCVCPCTYRCVCALWSQKQYDFRHLLWQLTLSSWILQCFDTVWNRSFIAWGLLIALTTFFSLDFSWHCWWHTTLMFRLWKKFFLMRQMCIQLFSDTDVFSW